MAGDGKRGRGEVRAAGPDDADSLADLIRTAFAAQEAATDPPPSALRETGASVREQLAAGGGLVIGTPPVGGLIWSARDAGLYIGRLAVHPDHRRRGIATDLLAGAEAIARDRGLIRLILSTRLVLAGNRRLFARRGFVDIAEHAHPGYDRPTFISMEKVV